MVDFTQVDINNFTNPPAFRFNTTLPNVSINMSEQISWLQGFMSNNTTMFKPLEKMLVTETHGFGLFALCLAVIGLTWFKTRSVEGIAVMSILLSVLLTVLNFVSPFTEPIQIILMWVFIFSFAGLLYLLYKTRE